MELFFLIMLLVVMATALGSGYPVAFALPGSAIVTIGTAALAGYIFAGDPAAYFALGGPTQWLNAGVTNFRGVYWEVERDTLIAIPLFVFMGIMLQRSKIAEDLLVAMAQLFGPVPGGLGISVVFVGALLAATTGIVGATVVAMGLISLPAMLRNNYSHPLATGTIAASGTLGQIIPPSIVLIILADQLSSAVDQASTARKALYKVATGEISMPSQFDVGSTSAGEMFLGAFVPGLILVVVYMAFILCLSLMRPKMAPAVPFDGEYDRKFAWRVVLILVPPLALIFLVLGSIIAGIATVNQAGAIGAVGALVMAGYRLHEGRKFTYTPAIMAILATIAIGVILKFFDTNIKSIDDGHDLLGVILAAIAVGFMMLGILWSGWRVWKIENTMYSVMVDTAKTTCLVFIILLGAAMLTASFRAFGGEHLVREFLTGLPGGFWGQFIIVMMVVFVLGFFLDFIEIAVVVVPIVAPILLADPSANVTAVWLGVMIGLNIQTSFLTPPFGFALFYLRGVAPAVVKTVSIYKGVVAFIILQLVVLSVVANFPRLVNYLPNRVSLLSDTAPPPLNPRLQSCIEKLVFTDLDNNGDKIKSAIGDAQKLDYSYLPEKLQKNVIASFDKAASSFDLMDAIRKAEAAEAAASGDYRPLHFEVRHLQSAAFKLDQQLKKIETRLRRVRGDDDKADKQRARLQSHIDQMKQEKTETLAKIPAEWDGAHKSFASLQKTENTARRKYQNAVDGAYKPILELKTLLNDVDKLEGFGAIIRKLDAVVANDEPQAAVHKLKHAMDEASDIAGARNIRTEINNARKALKAKTPNRDKAIAAMVKAHKNYQADLGWRQKAKGELVAKINAYDATIRTNIGLRQQPRLPEEQALSVAACSAYHHDVSLNF